MRSTYFLTEEFLGVLAVTMKQEFTNPTRKPRARSFAKYAKVLHGLNIIPPEHKILFLSFGCNPAGDYGLIVVTEVEDARS